MKEKILIIIVLFFFILLVLFVKTYSRYNSGASGNNEVQIAKWGVKLNGIPITTDDQIVPISMNNAICVQGCDVLNGKISPALFIRYQLKLTHQNLRFLWNMS